MFCRLSARSLRSRSDLVRSRRFTLLLPTVRTTPRASVSPQTRETAPSCAVDHGFSQLEPGATLRLVGAWPATTALDAPAVSGEYVLRAEFPMLRTDVPLVPAAYRGDREIVPSASSCRCS